MIKNIGETLLGIVEVIGVIAFNIIIGLISLAVGLVILGWILAAVGVM